VTIVSKQTRKPMPIPDWWKEKYGSSAVGNERLVIQAEQIPSDPAVNLARYEMKIPWNEMDGYGHTNYLSYIKFCFDAAADAVAKNAYSAFSGDILRYNVKTIQLLFKAESRPNDMLEVVSWQSPTNPYQLHFTIQKEGVGMIFQSCIEFHKDAAHI
jgi:acyl-CoA thioesterase FadM